jgi:RNA-directed DNA polymerase
MLIGYYAYYGLRGNVASLKKFRFYVEQAWMKWLGRRSQRCAPLEVRARILQLFPLPMARVKHG